MKKSIFILGAIITMFGFGLGGGVMDIFTARAAGFSDISGTDAVKVIKTEKNILVLDVRTPQEYAEGHLKGAKLIPVDELTRRTSEIADFKKKKVLVVCRSGVRSRQGSGILVNAGFEQVYNVTGGMMGIGQIPGAPIER